MGRSTPQEIQDQGKTSLLSWINVRRRDNLLKFHIWQSNIKSHIER